MRVGEQGYEYFDSGLRYHPEGGIGALFRWSEMIDFHDSVYLREAWAGKIRKGWACLIKKAVDQHGGYLHCLNSE